MPYISVESGSLTGEQKELLAMRLVEVASEIMDIPSQFFFTSIKELPENNLGFGGKTLAKVKKEYMASQEN